MNRHTTFAVASPVHAGPLAASPAAEEAPLPATLPSWCDNAHGRQLIAAIVASPPDKRNYDNGCSKWGGWQYAGKTANALRRLYNAALTEICDRETALFRAGKDYGRVHQELAALMNGERPDDLISRVLAEAGL